MFKVIVVGSCRVSSFFFDLIKIMLLEIEDKGIIFWWLNKEMFLLRRYFLVG